MAYFQIFPTAPSTPRIQDPSNRRHVRMNDSAEISQVRHGFSYILFPDPWSLKAKLWVSDLFWFILQQKSPGSPPWLLQSCCFHDSHGLRISVFSHMIWKIQSFSEVETLFNFFCFSFFSFLISIKGYEGGDVFLFCFI